MRYLLLLALITLVEPARSQIGSGTAIFVNRSLDDEVTVAADSRMNLQGGTHEDGECKISEFGNRFLFSMSGVVQREGAVAWNAHSIAFEAWKDKSEKVRDAKTLTYEVAEAWKSKMRELYEDPTVIQDARHRMKVGDDPVLANALFIATDSTGQISVHAMNVWFDLALFDRAKRALVLYDTEDLQKNQHVFAGLSEIMEEFRDQKSNRAKEFMHWYASRISTLSESDQMAETASKLIELSILLHPRNRELGFPVDVVQFRPKVGTVNRWIKPQCIALAKGEQKPN
jgi:hypothetical protein